jgi:hypothetical protein
MSESVHHHLALSIYPKTITIATNTKTFEFRWEGPAGFDLTRQISGLMMAVTIIGKRLFLLIMQGEF